MAVFTVNAPAIDDRRFPERSQTDVVVGIHAAKVSREET